MWREGRVLEPDLSISAADPILFVTEYAIKMNEEQDQERGQKKKERDISRNNMQLVKYYVIKKDKTQL